MTKEIEVSFIVSESGELVFTRSESVTNQEIFEILQSGILDEQQTAAVHRFFEDFESVELLMGAEPLCG